MMQDINTLLKIITKRLNMEKNKSFEMQINIIIQLMTPGALCKTIFRRV